MAWAPKIAFPNSKCPLEDTGKNSVNPWMIPRMMASINSKLFFVFVRVQQNGVYLNAQTDEHQGRCQSNPSKTVDIRIEYVGIVAPAASHQNKAQGNKGNADKEEKVIFLLKNELLAGFFVILVFLAHAAKLIIKIIRP